MESFNEKLNCQEVRMACYAKLLLCQAERGESLLDGNRLKLSPEDEHEWRRDLPEAIEAQYTLLDRGGLPVPMTLENVRRLKTLQMKNANFGALCRDRQCRQSSEGDGMGGG